MTKTEVDFRVKFHMHCCRLQKKYLKKRQAEDGPDASSRNNRPVKSQRTDPPIAPTTKPAAKTACKSKPNKPKRKAKPAV